MTSLARSVTVQGAGEYPINVRHWCPRKDVDTQIMILHGVVSHSEWLDPIAGFLVEKNIEVICPDRRGTGLNTLHPGDAQDERTLVEDVELVRRHFSKPGVDMHIAGFCWGATYAICCAEKLRPAFPSLVLIAPFVFPAPDIAKTHVVTGESSRATEEPLVPIDRFTSGPDYENYIVPDKLRTRFVSPRFNSAMVAMTAMIAPRWARLTLPSLMILASDDRLTDNEKHQQAFGFLKATPKQMIVVSSEHGVQFDAPKETADSIATWLASSKP